MKKIIIALLLFSTPAFAGNKFFVCLYENTGERFNIVTIDGQDKIQWGSDNFEAIISKFDGKFLTVTQIGRIGVFKMALDVKTGEGYAAVERFNGEKIGSKVLCAITE